VTPKIRRPPGARYHVVVTEISDQGNQVAFDHTGDAFIAAVANLTGTRITAEVNHDGEQLLRERLVAYITDAVHNPPQR
jgi:hypothetical protein